MINVRATPPTSPQRAWSSGRQAERAQRELGSPPSRRQPRPTAPMSNMPVALIVSFYHMYIIIISCIYEFVF